MKRLYRFVWLKVLVSLEGRVSSDGSGNVECSWVIKRIGIEYIKDKIKLGVLESYRSLIFSKLMLFSVLRNNTLTEGDISKSDVNSQWI